MGSPSVLQGDQLDRYYHACAFFHGPDEEAAVTTPFLREGLERGEKAVYITDPRLRGHHVTRLEEAGIDVKAGADQGQLQVLTWDEAYLKGGRFDTESMLELVEDVLRASRASGWERTRIIGHMEWALERRPGVEHLLEYEARVNNVLSRHRQCAVCAYDVTRFGGAVIVDVLRTHPMVVIGGILYENPFFVPPAEFLRELRERRASHRNGAAAPSPAPPAGPRPGAPPPAPPPPPPPPPPRPHPPSTLPGPRSDPSGTCARSSTGLRRRIP